MAPSTEDNLGRRRFILHRDKAIEHALEKIRRGPHAGWETFTPEERAALRKVLSDVWENTDGERWQQFCFSTLSTADIHRLIHLGEDLKARHHLSPETQASMDAILSACSLEDQ